MTGIGVAAAERLAAAGVTTIEPGLSDDEFARVESTFGVEFGDDHRAFLAAGLPVGGSWPDWRSEGRRSLAKRLQLPLEGVLFAVEWAEFWHDGWGRRPAKMKDALRSARYQLERAPQLVPVYSHHYLPDGRASLGHAVLSVVQTDVVVYGTDLAHYIDNEFGGGGPGHRDPEAATVAFWSELISR